MVLLPHSCLLVLALLATLSAAKDQNFHEENPAEENGGQRSQGDKVIPPQSGRTLGDRYFFDFGFDKFDSCPSFPTNNAEEETLKTKCVFPNVVEEGYYVSPGQHAKKDMSCALYITSPPRMEAQIDFNFIDPNPQACNTMCVVTPTPKGSSCCGSGAVFSIYHTSGKMIVFTKLVSSTNWTAVVKFSPMNMNTKARLSPRLPPPLSTLSNLNPSGQDLQHLERDQLSMASVFCKM